MGRFMDSEHGCLDREATSTWRSLQVKCSLSNGRSFFASGGIVGSTTSRISPTSVLCGAAGCGRAKLIAGS